MELGSGLSCVHDGISCHYPRDLKADVCHDHRRFEPKLGPNGRHIRYYGSLLDNTITSDLIEIPHRNIPRHTRA